MAAPYPLGLDQIDEHTLLIRWSDGKARQYSVRELRLSCGCANCKDEWTGDRLLDPKKVPEGIKPKRIVPVGRYALQIFWEDGHDTGIYPFEVLYGLGSESAAGHC